MTDFRALLSALVSNKVEFILVGGVAATVYGSARLTQDLDIVYNRDIQDIQRLIKSLEEFKPYLRGAPPGLPFLWDVQTIEKGLNFTLTTTVGDIDLLGEIVGGGRFEDLVNDSITLELFGFRCRCLNLKKLIQVKRAAGRPKDFESIAELELLLSQNKDKQL